MGGGGSFLILKNQRWLFTVNTKKGVACDIFFLQDQVASLPYHYKHVYMNIYKTYTCSTLSFSLHSFFLHLCSPPSTGDQSHDFVLTLGYQDKYLA